MPTIPSMLPAYCILFYTQLKALSWVGPIVSLSPWDLCTNLRFPGCCDFTEQSTNSDWKSIKYWIPQRTLSLPFTEFQTGQSLVQTHRTSYSHLNAPEQVTKCVSAGLCVRNCTQAGGKLCGCTRSHRALLCPPKPQQDALMVANNQWMADDH